MHGIAALFVSTITGSFSRKNAHKKIRNRKPKTVIKAEETNRKCQRINLQRESHSHFSGQVV
jgi:hypothetical protein